MNELIPIFSDISVIFFDLLIFIAAYPKPLLERMEYAPVYLVFCLVVLSCYNVLLQSVRKTRRIR